MGGKTTKLFRSSPQPNTKDQTDNNSPYHEHHKNHNNHDIQLPDDPVVKNPLSPFVYYRKGSMYIDEDGDIAHEFYAETKIGSKLTLKQISNQHLKPQGDVPLDVPCLRNDYPVILLDQNRIKE
ncbi:tumor suppressor candidate 2-like [Rhopalosiphum maidis]|uniref:tumor suppressor candidate 2-like n=1 Tax=Rhopalosiphum maidis TaxID=43146 RepID=UPI000EFE3541|nr:tumor suppressor candidate 2-like [Rhopalosiphum maidis]XP_026816677.1 tumor suppressor candidate 2-like [Rhopalosiphum maidis]